MPEIFPQEANTEAMLPPVDKTGQEQPASWWRLALCTLCCSLASGIIPGQTLFVEFFVNAGIFSSACPNTHAQKGHKDKLGCDEQYLQMTSMLNLASVLLIVAQVVFGGVFDRLGGQVCGAVGSVVVAIGMLALAGIVLLVPVLPSYNSALSYGLICVVILVDMGSWLNSYAMMGLVWHFPRHQSLILSLLNATYQVGSFFALSVEVVLTRFHVSISVPLLGWAVLQGFATVLLWYIVPSQKEYFQRAKAVLGMPLPEPEKNLALCTKMRGSVEILALDAWPHSVLGLAFVFGTTLTFFYASMAVPLGVALFGLPDAGKRLGDICTFVNGIIGITTGPFLGSLVDHCGFGLLLYAQLVCLIVFSSTFWAASWAAATAAAASSSAYTALAYLLYMRWFMYFSTPNRIGMVMGIFYLFAGVVALVLNLALTSWSAVLPEGLSRFISPLAPTAVAAVLCTAALCVCYSVQHPFPKAPHLLPQDEAELAQSWGCQTLAEVGVMLDISNRDDLIVKLSSSDPEEVKALVRLVASKGEKDLGTCSANELELQQVNTGEAGVGP